MKKYDYYYEGLQPLDNLISLAAKDDILFFDIETTGLSKLKNHIYLIGCGYYSETGLNIIQWFAENENEERIILKEFEQFASSFSCLVNYNGKSFDVPFTSERFNKYGMNMPELDSIDIYLFVKPLKKLLSLNDLTQKTIERFLHIKREDKYNGGELISVYHNYVTLNSKIHPDTEALKAHLSVLLLHNLEDVLNMHYITDILYYSEILNSEIIFDSYEINNYKDYTGNEKTELIVVGLHNSKYYPHSFKTFSNDDSGSYIMNFSCSGKITIRVPIVNTTLKFFLDNYKDYYYLPNEDICILKSMAGGVLKENKKNATKDTCCIKCCDSFIMFPTPRIKKSCINELSGNVKLFRDCFKSNTAFVRLCDFENWDVSEKQNYINLIFNYFV